MSVRCMCPSCMCIERLLTQYLRPDGWRSTTFGSGFRSKNAWGIRRIIIRRWRTFGMEAVITIRSKQMCFLDRLTTNWRPNSVSVIDIFGRFSRSPPTPPNIASFSMWVVSGHSLSSHNHNVYCLRTEFDLRSSKHRPMKKYPNDTTTTYNTYRTSNRRSISSFRLMSMR